MKLVIVESPAKAKTIRKYLGEGYMVDASGGHVSDLPQKALGVDIEHNYKPTYEITSTKKDVIKRLNNEIKKSDFVYLATDPDREGEAISWHLQNALKLDKNLENRIVFNEITKKAVQEAIKKPRKVDMNLVDAQQARRVLDRLVGYKLSPILCKKIRGNLSAGRVQSAALKIIVDREREILAFKPEEYWNVNAFLYKDEEKPIIFKALLSEKNGKKFKITDKAICDNVLNEIKDKPYIVKTIKKTQSKSNPQPPFTTSTLQQDSGSKLNMSSKLTMQIAQQLYEGIDIEGEGHTAFVTYIRTDSVRISEDAQKAAKDFLIEKYGEKYAPEKFNIYKSKKDAQDAHEAIRPISLKVTPESIKDKLSRDQYRLYKLIYERFLASQSTPAIFDMMTVTIYCSNYGFKAVGKTPVFDGYLKIYGKTEKDEKDDEESVKMPAMNEGDELLLSDIKAEQKFTKPPLRYTESSLVKAMEENGIGRPSTYATILTTLYNRKYMEQEKKTIIPTQLGFTVTEYLEKYFSDIVDTEFTAQMENKLDNVEEKGDNWTQVIDEFYKPFNDKLKNAMHGEAMRIEPVMTEEKCEKCGANMLLKDGPYGQYLACSNYPECKNIKSLKQKEEAVVTDILCEKCGKPMVEKMGRYGKYLACSGYPECKNIKSLKPKEEPKVTDILCEKCGKPMLERNGRYGKYLACSGYPECKNIKSMKEVDEPKVTDILCEKCGKPMIERNGRYGKYLACSGYPECKNIKSLKDKKQQKVCSLCGEPMTLIDSGSDKIYRCTNEGCGHTEDYTEKGNE